MASVLIFKILWRSMDKHGVEERVVLMN